jgi:hypothetical protein
MAVDPVNVRCWWRSGQSLELIAEVFGVTDWNTLAALTTLA